MRLRIFLIEPNDAICESLRLFLEESGHEVVSDAWPVICPHLLAADQFCTSTRPCADAVILGQHLPNLKGIDLIERRLRGGCKGMVANVALLCLPWSDSDRQRAERLGCHYFETPLRLDELAAWLQAVLLRINPQRQLAPLPLPAVAALADDCRGAAGVFGRLGS